VVAAEEGCDDGNTANGDGCDARCRVEVDDGCVPMVFAMLTLSRLGAPAGDDRLTFEGSAGLPYPFWPGLDPIGKGVRFVVTDAGGMRIVDAALPGGAYDAARRQGWRASAGGDRWKFVSRDGVHGIVRLNLRDASATAPGLVAVKVKGRNGAYAPNPAELPLRVVLELDPMPQCMRAGPVGAGSTCSFNASGRTLRCN